jgi:hypothetical protein
VRHGCLTSLGLAQPATRVAGGRAPNTTSTSYNNHFADIDLDGVLLSVCAKLRFAASCSRRLVSRVGEQSSPGRAGYSGLPRATVGRDPHCRHPALWMRHILTMDSVPETYEIARRMWKFWKNCREMLSGAAG